MMEHFAHFILGILFLSQGCNASLKYEKLLHAKLLNDYNLDIRPEPGHGKPVDVHFDVRLKKLVKLDVREQVFIINAFTMLKWKDPQLTWNISEYDEVKHITMGTDLIWTPDIVLYNTADIESYSHTDYYKTKALVTYDGNVVWTNPVTWKASCPFDVTWFPVDKQVCKLTFGSWTYTSTQLIIEPWGAHSREQSHDHFTIKNGEWNMEEMDLIQEKIKFPCCSEPYSTMSKVFLLERRSLYYFLYILLPLISLAFLFLMVFFIPHESGERMGFGVTILLSITVYLLVISEALPEKSDDKSMLGICFISEFYLLCASLVLSLLTINLSRKTTEPPRILFQLHDAYKRFSFSKLINNLRKRDGDAMVEMTQLESEGYLHGNGNNHNNGGKNSVDYSRSLLHKPKKHDDTDSAHGDQSNQSEEEKNNADWQKIASFLDRIFLFFTAFFLGFIPVIITSSLDKSGLS